jgi:hypothetical protein
MMGAIGDAKQGQLSAIFQGDDLCGRILCRPGYTCGQDDSKAPKNNVSYLFHGLRRYLRELSNDMTNQ